MLYLAIAIATMSIFMLTLKFLAVKNITSSHAIIINYILAFTFGILLYKGDFAFSLLFSNNWWYISILAGVLLFTNMHLLAASTRIAGVAVTTISSRTALIMPIVIAFLFLGESITMWQIVGVSLVLVALVIIFYQKNDKTISKSDRIKAILMPIGVFLSIGMIAICMKSAQHIISIEGDSERDIPLYQTLSFMTALICAITYYAVTNRKHLLQFNWKSMAGGVVLGTSNFLATTSILFALMSVPTSVFYAAYNIGVVVITIFISWIAFGEKLSTQKVIGIFTAIIAILILMLLG